MSAAWQGNWKKRLLERLHHQGFATLTDYLRQKPAVPYLEIADILGTDRKSTMFLVQRIISIDDAPIALHTVFTHTRYVSRIPREKIGQQAMIGLIEEHCRIQASRTRQIATAVTADAQAAKLLGVRVGSPMLLLKRIYTTGDDKPMQYSELMCRPDRYHHTVDFHRTDSVAGDGVGRFEGRSKDDATSQRAATKHAATKHAAAKHAAAKRVAAKRGGAKDATAKRGTLKGATLKGAAARGPTVRRKISTKAGRAALRPRT